MTEAGGRTITQHHGMQPFPEPSTVLSHIGATAPIQADVGHLISRAAAAARKVTGGVGFGNDGLSVEAEIGEVLVRGVARTLLNPEVSLVASQEPFTARPGAFASWSDADFLILASYRARGSVPGSDG